MRWDKTFVALGLIVIGSILIVNCLTHILTEAECKEVLNERPGYHQEV